jgi:hypothetical protein
MNRAMLLALLMASMSLAGCVAPDDAGPIEVQMTDEQLDALFEEHFQDFVNNSTVTVNDYTTTNDNTSNHYNGSSGSFVEYFVVDYIFTESDLTGVNTPVNRMNNSFTAIDNISHDNHSDDNSTEEHNTGFSYELDCMDYYFLYSDGAVETYWENNNTGFMMVWTNQYNSTIADLYQAYAYRTSTRETCDNSYFPNGNQAPADLLHIMDITVPAGKAIQCPTSATSYSIKAWYANEGYYSHAYGESYVTNSQWPQHHYQTAVSQQWDGILGSYCGQMLYGSGSADTTFSFWVEDRGIHPQKTYRLYFVYTLVDVSDHA